MQQAEKRKLIRNDEGRYFLVRVVEDGMSYGRDDCLNHRRAKDGGLNDDVLVEFYDFTYSTVIKTESPFGERGQFTGGRYYLKTLLELHDELLPPRALILHGGIPSWTIDSEAMSEVMRWLRSTRISEPISEPISERKSEDESPQESSPRSSDDKTLKIIYREREDVAPDLDYLGRYCNQFVDDGARVIDRFPDNDSYSYAALREARYFVAYVPLNEINPKTGKPYTRQTIRKWAKRQYERMEAYNQDDWSMVGLTVEAIVTKDNDALDWKPIWHSETPGLWNVENDSGSEYMEEVWAEQMAEMHDELIEQGFSEDEIAAAVEAREYR